MVKEKNFDYLSYYKNHKDDFENEKFENIDIHHLKKYCMNNYNYNDFRYDECIICLESFYQNEEVLSLPVCSHPYHLDCFIEWVKSDNRCPFCKVNIRHCLYLLIASGVKFQKKKKGVMLKLKSASETKDSKNSLRTALIE